MSEEKWKITTGDKNLLLSNKRRWGVGKKLMELGKIGDLLEIGGEDRDG